MTKIEARRLADCIGDSIKGNEGAGPIVGVRRAWFRRVNVQTANRKVANYRRTELVQLANR